jgi:hypothetical protein
MLFLNKNSNKTIGYKKEYFIQKIEITPKRLQIGIISIHFDCDHNEKHSRRCLAVCCIRLTLNICVV